MCVCVCVCACARVSADVYMSVIVCKQVLHICRYGVRAVPGVKLGVWADVEILRNVGELVRVDK